MDGNLSRKLGNSDSKLWQWILVGSTAGMYALTITLTGLMYDFFAGQSCTLNQFSITFNLILCIIITVLCVTQLSKRLTHALGWHN